MPSEEFEHAGIRYALQLTYALPDGAWCVEKVALEIERCRGNGSVVG